MPKKILVVEGNPAVRDYLEKRLKVHYEVRTACNGEDGFKIAKEWLPDLITTEFRLPGIDGLEFRKLLTGNEPTSSIPIIMITGYPSAELFDTCREEGFFAVLTKPFELELLSGIAQRALRREQYSPAQTNQP